MKEKERVAWNIDWVLQGYFQDIDPTISGAIMSIEGIAILADSQELPSPPFAVYEKDRVPFADGYSGAQHAMLVAGWRKVV